MRIFFVAIVLSMGLAANAQTTLYIVGVVHDPTPNFNADSIVNILTKLKPDLILLEFDS